MKYKRLDHTVLTVSDVAATVSFYENVLGMDVITFDSLQAGRKALRFGDSKINIHEYGNEIPPHAQNPGPGTEHLCFIVDDPIADVEHAIRSAGAVIEEGPVERTGALGTILSVYVRDPDGNLIELSNYLDETAQDIERVK